MIGCEAFGRGIGAGLGLLAIGLLLGQFGPVAAQPAAAWEASGLDGQRIDRLFTPTSGALLAGQPDALFRSDDSGLTWRTIGHPPETKVVTVAPTSHDLLYAAGWGGVFRSEDGGGDWQRVSDQGDNWTFLEISPADPTVIYGVALTSPPAEYGTNRWQEFRVSRDAGATWETVRIQRERVVPGTHPCWYDVRLLQPHTVSTARVLTIEGCTGRGNDPMAGLSPDEGRTVALFPNLQPELVGASSAVGGGGVNPGRWYVSTFAPGIPYTRIRHSRIFRTDDDGQSWTAVYEGHGGSPDQGTGVPVEMADALAYNPMRPDDLFAVMLRYQPAAERGAQHTLAGLHVRRSRDGGMSWQELGAPDVPSVSRLALGIDGRYLFAATGEGVYRLAVPE